MERNGSPKPHFETDDDRTYFLATLPIHRNLKEQAQAGDQAKVQGQQYTLNNIKKAILAYLEKSPSSRSDIIDHLGSGSMSEYFKETLKGLLENENVCHMLTKTKIERILNY